MPSESFDILVLGATGFVGRLITRYLANHPQQKLFTVGLGARSPQRLANLVLELGLDSNAVTLVEVDVLKQESVDAAVGRSKVVINTVGPYWSWGTAVVQSCVAQGKHYVDLTGEAAWVREIITLFDYTATKTGAIIVPSVGFDSLPSDLAVYLSNKALKGVLGTEAGIDESITAWETIGGSISGGTFATLICALEVVPKDKLAYASRDYSLSPVKGVPSTFKIPRLFYTLPHSNIVGSWFMMESQNRSVVQRSWGLNKLARRQNKNAKESSLLMYGDQFKYREILVMPNKVVAIVVNLSLLFLGIGLLFKPFRWLFKKMIPKAGEGASDEAMAKASCVGTNITTSIPTPSAPRTTVRTVIKGHGDPGYLLTATMIAESALALLLNHDALPAFAKTGGILTPSTAMGDIIVRRLEETGEFEFETEVILGEAAEEARKRR